MYIFAILFGILCVQYRFFEKLKIDKKGIRSVLWICVLGIILLFIYGRFMLVAETFEYKARNLHHVLYGMVAVGVCLLSYWIKSRAIIKILGFLGVHSGNIFMIHMFLVKNMGRYVYYFKTL